MKVFQKRKTVLEQKSELIRDKKRGEITFSLLTILGHSALGTAHLLMAFAPGTTREMARGVRRRHKQLDRVLHDAQERHRFYSMLSRLEQSGFITKENRTGDVLWHITKKGSEKKALLGYYIKRMLPTLSVSHYMHIKSVEPILVIFDIPEKESYKRVWLRSTLKNLGFSLLQESVWMGDVQLPREFILDLKKNNILDYIQIFSVSRIGTLYADR